MMYEKIKKFCDDKGISVNQFESICNFPHGTVAKLKNHLPSAKKVKRIAQVMGITMEKLMENEVD